VETEETLVIDLLPSVRQEVYDAIAQAQPLVHQGCHPCPPHFGAPDNDIDVVLTIAL
jgi:hypothetical protein